MLKKKTEDKNYKEAPGKYKFWAPGSMGIQVEDPSRVFDLTMNSDYSWEMVGKDWKEPIKHKRKVLSIKKGDI